MTFIERLNKDRQQLSRLPDNKSRITFIWDYYKIPIIVFLSVLLLSVILLISNIGRKDASMYVVLLNNDSSLRECDSTIFDEALKKTDLDLKGKSVDVNDKLSVGQEGNEAEDIETMQILTALFTISDLDLYVADKQYFDYFLEDGGYADLSLLIDQNLLERYKDDLYYWENQYGQKTLCGIILHNDSMLHKAGYYHNDVIMGVVANANNLQAAVEFIRQMLSDRN
ncbi:MAG: hypothetical protein IIZ80_02325 [Erysipelotrichaceae bacterium]|nr:hypothetical protein [Erysipelotrichaceae bacterium]